MLLSSAAMAADPSEVLSHLLLALRVAVAKLEVQAAQRETSARVERWIIAQRCAREVGLVFEALDVAPCSARLPLARGVVDPIATLIGAYDAALATGLPRAVRALLLEHRTLLEGASASGRMASAA
jgi:hypothetical protein